MTENDSTTVKMMRKEMDGLKDDMKSLRQKFRRLEEAIGRVAVQWDNMDHLKAGAGGWQEGGAVGQH